MHVREAPIHWFHFNCVHSTSLISTSYLVWFMELRVKFISKRDLHIFVSICMYMAYVLNEKKLGRIRCGNNCLSSSVAVLVLLLLQYKLCNWLSSGSLSMVLSISLLVIPLCKLRLSRCYPFQPSHSYAWYTRSCFRAL